MRTGMKAGAAALAWALWIAPAQAQVTGVTDTEITIGALGVLTGPLYDNGKTVYDGVETVYDEVNAAGGINGRKLIYVREDDMCRPDQAVPAVKKLIDADHVFFIHGGGCSNASLAAMPDIVAAKIPWVITASTAVELTQPVNPLIFTTMLTGPMETAGELQRLLDLGVQKIAVVRQKDAWAESRYKPLLAQLAAKGVHTVADEEIAADPSDATAVALKLAASGADGVIALLFPKAATIVLRDMYKVGYKPIVVGGSAIGDLRGMGRAIGFPGALDHFSALFPGILPDDPKAQDWAIKVKRYFPQDELNVWHLIGIASGQFVVEALRRTGRDLTRDSFAKAMDTMSMTSPLLGGPLACKPEDHQCYRSMAWYALKEGKVVQVGATTLP